ncbi:EAL domain-containing protein [uncultured Propionivibrio sp.]|uniref:sensor domain-containing protein n=1 Tax=uncultured Propionivibrio sp. TaxID=426737 RepID=UPI0029C06358|nr:EAL domain-containing protein [uncultured Propionivibrio sp.]
MVSSGGRRAAVMVVGLGLIGAAWVASALELFSAGWDLKIASMPTVQNPLLAAIAALLLASVAAICLRGLRLNDAEAKALAVGEDPEKHRRIEEWASKLFQALDQNPATIFITDAEGRFEYVNDSFLQTTGYVRDAVLGQSMALLSPSDASSSPYAAMWAAARRGEAWKGEAQTRRRDGGLFWERVLFSPLKDRDGRITHFVAIKEDISELRSVLSRLQESEGRFRTATAAMVEGLVVIGSDGRILFANPAAEAFMACPPGGLVGVRAVDVRIDRLREDGTLYAPEDYPLTRSLRDQCELRGLVFGLRDAQGDVRWLEFNSSLLRMEADGAPGLVATFTDITERRKTEAQLRLAFEAIRQSGEGILMTDARHVILSVNPAFEAKTGYAADEVLGKTPAFLASGRNDADFYREMQARIEETGVWQGEIWNQRKNGEAYPEWLNVSGVRDNDGPPGNYVYVYSDMTERVEAQQRIDMLAHHDPLTGLPNRVLLRDRVEQAMAQASRLQSRVALMFLDLDRFKTINDSLGHPVGDELLKEAVNRLKRCVRDSDTISRQGGDEFMIVLNDVRDGDAVARVAEHIQQQMREPVDIEGHRLSTSFSIGVSIFPDDGQDFDTLLKKADTAMYHAKEAGRNGHRFFTEQMNRRVVEHLTMETQLRRALENGEFILHYQPQMDLNEGTIVGVEALIRWNSREHGLVSPARFIPVAEESGLIVPIGAWVLREACRQAREWQLAGIDPFVMAVNLSAVQFRHHDLINSVINALVLSDLDSQWLELELTESILIQDAEATLEAIRRLKSLGIKLSVDDFGTGYSSLTYLKRFSVDKLKIDQSFVRDLARDPEDAAIVRAIIQMAHSLRLRTIAEGVETEELASLLRVFHCDEIQGFWLARPMPAREMEDFLRSHQTRSVTGRQGVLL